ncbi:MAG: hypothetical protein ABI539_01795 [Acidobacteriota bacterium]
MNPGISILGCPVSASIILAVAVFAASAAAQNQSIKVSVSSAKVEKGASVHVTIESRVRGVKAVVVRPGIGVESLELKAESDGKDNILVGVVQVPGDSPDGMYVIHAWTGDARRPTAVGKGNFRGGSIIADFFIGNYVDKNDAAGDIDAYLKDFRSVGGNFLIAHNLIIPPGAFYSSKIIKRGSDADLVELLLERADRSGMPALLSVSWDMTRNTPLPGVSRK